MRRRRDPHAPRNGAGGASVLAGIVALLCAFVPFVGEWVAVPAAALAIGLGALGLWRVDQGRATNGGEAVAGLLMGVAAAAVTALVYAATSTTAD